MSTYSLRLAIVTAAALIPNIAWAQHDAHQSASSRAPGVDMTQCLRVQRVIENMITAATARAEAARLSNSPSDLRSAVDQMEAVLRDVRVQLAPCGAAAASTDPHAGHTMPSTPSPAATPPAQANRPTSDPHAGHATPNAASAPKPSATSKPSAPRPDAAKTGDPHAGHSEAPSGDKQRDPVNGLVVDPASAPKTTYQGQKYYFSSEQSRKEFLESPAKFAKKPKG
jgi:YHS domain-containing protein